MGAQKSIHAGKAKIDFNVDLTHKLCGALLVPPIRNSSSPFSQIVGRISIKHPDIFGGSEKLDLLWDKGLQDSNVVIAIRRPRPERLSQQSFIIQHSISPEIAVHGMPINRLSQMGSGGINISRFSAGVDLTEPPSTKWSTKTNMRFEHVNLINDDGRPIRLDHDGFPITCSGTSHDNMVVLKQESQYAVADDKKFSRLSFQIEQGLPLLSKWLIFNKFKFVASKGVRVGPALLVTSLTGASIVGDMAPHQAFSIGGYGSIRGYGEGAVGSGRSCLVMNTEFTVPLVCFSNLAYVVRKLAMISSTGYKTDKDEAIECCSVLLSKLLRLGYLCWPCCLISQLASYKDMRLRSSYHTSSHVVWFFAVED